MDKLRYCQDTIHNVLMGVQQGTRNSETPNGIIVNRHFVPRMRNSRRVLVIKFDGLDHKHIKRIEDIKIYLGRKAGLPDTTPLRIYYNGDFLVIEIPKKRRYTEKVTIEDLMQRRWHTGPIATLGLGLQDEPIRLNFADERVAHAMISGATRSGKTNNQQLLTWGLAKGNSPDDVKMIIIDVAKGGKTWRKFANIAHLQCPIITEQSEAEKVLTWLVEEINRRSAGDYETPRLFVIIDELRDLLRDSPTAGKNIAKLAAIAGEFNIHLVLATQYPYVKLLGEDGSEILKNCTSRLCGKVPDAASATSALGVPDSGGNHLTGLGDFLIYQEVLSRFTSAYLEDRHIETLERGNIADITLPGAHAVLNTPPEPVYQASPTIQYPDAEQVAVAIFERPEMGIQNFREKMGIKGTKEAARIIKYADKIREFALKRGYKCL